MNYFNVSLNHQVNPNDAELEKVVKEVKLDFDLFKRCMEDPRAKAELGEELIQAKTLGVQSGPDFYFNDEKVNSLDEVNSFLTKK